MFDSFHIGIGDKTLVVAHDSKLGVVYLENLESVGTGDVFAIKSSDVGWKDTENTMVCTSDELKGLLRDLLEVALAPGDYVEETLLAAVPGVGILAYVTDVGIGVIGKIDGSTVAVANLMDSRAPAPEPIGDIADACVSPISQVTEDASKTTPNHYKFPNGVQVIDITRNLDFLSGNVVKYVARAGRKAGESPMDDLLKARWYLNQLIKMEGRE